MREAAYYCPLLVAMNKKYMIQINILVYDRIEYYSLYTAWRHEIVVHHLYNGTIFMCNQLLNRVILLIVLFGDLFWGNRFALSEQSVI